MFNHLRNLASLLVTRLLVRQPVINLDSLSGNLQLIKNVLRNFDVVEPPLTNLSERILLQLGKTMTKLSLA